MAALPYIQLYVADYLADTAHLAAAQHGAYLLLIMNYWQRGKPLKDCDERLANVARMSNEEWCSAREALAEFFEIRDGWWIHHRIEADLERVAAKSSKAKASRQVAVNNKQKNTCSANVKRTLNHTDKDKEEDKDIVEGKPSTPPISPTAYSPEFERFWKSAPKTTCSKKEAAKSYQHAIKRGVSHETIIRGIEQYAEYLTATGSPAAHATTWLNNDRWGVDYSAALQQRHAMHSRSPMGARPTKDDRARAAVMRAAGNLGFAPEG